MPDPLVSVVVPVYKVEKYLARCLDSIVAQRYRPIEVILVNDGSPDGCGEIMRRYEARWPFIVSVWQENRGLGEARNTGIARATGEYLALVDSDDYIEPDYLGSLVAAAEKEQADAAVCGFYFNLQNGVKIPVPLATFHKTVTGEKAALMSLNYLKMPAFAWNKLYRRSLFVENRISFPSIYYEDVATASRILVNARRVAIVNKPYYHYCWRRSSISGRFGIKNIEDYLTVAAMIRQFIMERQLWPVWQKQYRYFLLNVEMLLFLETILQKNSIPPKSHLRLVRQTHHTLRGLRRGSSHRSGKS